jgi:hypothetical protein
MAITDKWLPIGSVVLLEDAGRLVMIYGRLQQATDDGKQWDYLGCLYPEGNIDSNHRFLFNRDQIERVFFVGFQSPEEYDLVRRLERAQAKAAAKAKAETAAEAA